MKRADVLAYIEANKGRFLDELIDFLKIPSISADSGKKDAVRTAAQWLVDELNRQKLDQVEIFETEGHPIVFARTIIDPAKPTVLVYGHYDVQPADPLDLWNSPPFEPIIKDEKIYARGACDDKGQLYMHIKALEILRQAGDLPCNIKFILEGEEEVGSAHLEPFVRQHAGLLACDVILISDTSMLANDVPSITVGLRGMAYMEVSVQGPNRDLHSGVYGGAVGNPINILCEMIASLKDENNHITIPGFYDKVQELSADERAAMARQPFNHQTYCDELGIGNTHGEKGFTPIEQTSIRPTLDVNGIWGGYMGEGSKTVLPAVAHAKISMRLVPHQQSQEIADLFSRHFQQIAPPSVKVTVKNLHGGEAAVISTHSKSYLAAEKAMFESFGKQPIPTREGGSIPIVALFQQVLKADTVLLGFGLNSDAIHSPNEHFGLFNFYKGIETLPLFHYYFASK